MKRICLLAVGVLVLAGLGLACAGSPPTTSPSDQQQAVDLAKSRLATKLGIQVSEVTAVKVEAVNWPDTSLGAPEPGKYYAQVITPGFRIVLAAGGKEYEYHAGKLGGQMTVVEYNK